MPRRSFRRPSNLFLLAVAGYLYWLHRNRERLGGGKGYALDPMCGMQIRIEDAPARRSHDGRDYWFCSDHCAERFAADPEAHAHAGPTPHE
jgi:YHS domain-containing protein